MFAIAIFRQMSQFIIFLSPSIMPVRWLPVLPSVEQQQQQQYQRRLLRINGQERHATVGRVSRSKGLAGQWVIVLRRTAKPVERKWCCLCVCVFPNHVWPNKDNNAEKADIERIACERVLFYSAPTVVVPRIRSRKWTLTDHREILEGGNGTLQLFCLPARQTQTLHTLDDSARSRIGAVKDG